jgi:cytochrome c556
MRLGILASVALALVSCAAAEPSSSGTVSAAAANVAPSEPTVSQLIAARQAGMHMAATLLATDIRNVVNAHLDVRQHMHEPDGIAMWAAAIPGLFPTGSMGESRARPEIWLNKADFNQKALNLQHAAEELSRRGAAGDTAGYAEQARAVQGACAACHALYRTEN